MSDALEALLSVARILLAAVFVVAAIAKVADLDGARGAARDFGAPARLAAPLAPALAVAELAVAVLLIPAGTALAAAAGALVLLLGFTAAIAASLARGHAPACHCFGQLHSAPAGWATLARNGALAGVAAFALAGSVAEPPAGAFGWVADLTGTEALALGLGLALAAAVGAGLAAFFSLLRSYGRVLLRVERLEDALADAGYELDDDVAEERLGLDPGTPAPSFELAGADGAAVTLEGLLAPRLPLVLLFTSPGCGSCDTLLPDMASWQSAHADRLTVAVLSGGEPAESHGVAVRHGLQNVLADGGDEIYRAYQANGTPSGVLIGTDGNVASFLATGPATIAKLVAEVLDAPGLPVGAPAPRLDELASLNGAIPSVGERESVVLFWNPDCGYCRAIHQDLLELEANANGSTPQLLVISSGDEERTRADGFNSPVLLDPDWSAGDRFGASGTPSAVVVDADGRVDSEVLVGGQAILGRLRVPLLARVEERE